MTAARPPEGARRTLLVTRPRPQCAAWLARLAALGVPAAALPLIEILPARDRGAVAAAWAALPAADLAVFVSPNAVEQFFAQAGAAPWPADTLAACVGPGSAQALVAHGVPLAQVVQPAADAASLDSEHLWSQLAPRRDWAGARVLLLRGDGGREWLAERLAESGAHVDAVTVYHRAAPGFEPAEAALLADVLAAPSRYAWLFSSAEAIGHLRGLALAGQCGIATHPRIAEAARSAGFDPVVLARPDPEAVARALKAL
ncbi:uroporphyrinogen-III synthase [Roseateles sp.]|uniref:uroporphyrinogen-III synthase n=1 Tax=Roseateles sp. TaxID=1971397 RepID=UPI003BAAE01F